MVPSRTTFVHPAHDSTPSEIGMTQSLVDSIECLQNSSNDMHEIYVKRQLAKGLLSQALFAESQSLPNARQAFINSQNYLALEALAEIEKEVKAEMNLTFG